MQVKDINWGQEFLPPYPDAYLSEDLPSQNGTCPMCRSKLLKIKGEDKPYCTRCYLAYKKENDTGEGSLSATDREFLLELMLERFANENVEVKK